MDVSIITWDENYYDSCYEDYLQIMKNNEIVYYGYWYELISYNEEARYKFVFEFNYGDIKNKCDTGIVKFENNFLMVPYREKVYQHNYKYLPLKFTKQQLLRLMSKEEISLINKISCSDILLQWLGLSNFKGYFDTFEEYKKQLFYDIYFVDIDKLDDNIENFFKEISKLRNREIVKILKNDFEIVTAYLNTGKIWEAFLKKDDKIYLNTELDVSIDVTDIVEKYYKKS